MYFFDLRKLWRRSTFFPSFFLLPLSLSLILLSILSSLLSSLPSFFLLDLQQHLAPTWFPWLFSFSHSCFAPSFAQQILEGLKLVCSFESTRSILVLCPQWSFRTCFIKAKAIVDPLFRIINEKSFTWGDPVLWEKKRWPGWTHSGSHKRSTFQRLRSQAPSF